MLHDLSVLDTGNWPSTPGIRHVSTIIPDVATAIWDCLVEEFMAVPSTEEWRSIAGKFEERWNFPLCCGALDGKHVVLKAPENTGSQFFNYKGTFSLVLLAVVDAERCFRVIDVGGYGRTSDGGILANSAFGQALKSGSLQLPAGLPLPAGDHLGPLPHVFVADEAFPLRKNLMRPFPGRNLPRERRIFNYRLSRARLVVENAFWILSSQWRMYRRVIEVQPEVAEKFVKATCILHNFLRRTTQANTQRPFSVAYVEPLPGLGRIAANNPAREAIRVREVFTSYFNAEERSRGKTTCNAPAHKGSFKSHPHILLSNLLQHFYPNTRFRSPIDNIISVKSMNYCFVR
ncbi:hypothetical protein JOQ06_023330 [Pogonophryne albipinna]|uniref:DDE Tnp4 domain-containing protein n=1 Tax=Pogonophryne albipinna TaxID=1090488 RepID=A0AAD6FRQ1_9TELE|nr:hypothetical protein JOQ06_023330 [Pogonophryne albipinna]